LGVRYSRKDAQRKKTKGSRKGGGKGVAYQKTKNRNQRYDLQGELKVHGVKKLERRSRTLRNVEVGLRKRKRRGGKAGGVTDFGQN